MFKLLRVLLRMCGLYTEEVSDDYQRWYIFTAHARYPSCYSHVMQAPYM